METKIKKFILVFILLILVITTTFIFIFLYRNNVIVVPFGNVEVQNEEYGFCLSYPRKFGLNKVTKIDYGLSGDEKTKKIYSYYAEGPYVGSFTNRIFLNIYNETLEEYLSEKNNKESVNIEKVNIFNTNGYRILHKSQKPNSDKSEDQLGGNSGFCYYVLYHNNFLFVVDCEASYNYSFKFLK